MPGPTNTVPQPPRQGAMRAGDTDIRSFSFVNDFQGVPGDMMASSGLISVSVARVDGASISPADLAPIGFITLDPTAQIVQSEFYAPPGLGATDYVISVGGHTVQGRYITRDAFMMVSPRVG